MGDVDRKGVWVTLRSWTKVMYVPAERPGWLHGRTPVTYHYGPFAGETCDIDSTRVVHTYTMGTLCIAFGGNGCSAMGNPRRDYYSDQVCRDQ